MSVARRAPLLLLAALLVAGAGPRTLAAQAGSAAPPATPPASAPASAQATTAQLPAANPADVASVDAILGALYASISGPKDAPRDWARLRTLFGPNARLIPAISRADGRAGLRNWSVEEYITAAEPGLVAGGFFEREIGRTTQRFGSVTHVMSAYDSKRTLEDAAPFQRGVNSIQLFYNGTRWYILSIMWDAEREGNAIAPEYLRPARP